MLKLIGTCENQYYAWNILPGKYVIGRKTAGNSGCDLAISDRAVSRRHAVLEVDADGKTCRIDDLNSHNGTIVNGKKVTEPVVLKIGDHLQFGQAEFRLTDAPANEASATPTRPDSIVMPQRQPEASVLMTMAEIMQPLSKPLTKTPELLQTLSEMARMLILNETEETHLEKSLDLVARVVPADRLAVLFRTEDNGSDVYPAAKLLPGGKDLGTFNLSQTIINKILTDKAAILIKDAEEDPRFAEQKSIIISEMKSAMAVPLFDEGQVLGILYADTTNPGHRYDDESLRLFAIMGNIIASRLNNITLLKERAEKQVYEAELNRASAIQKNLLPAQVPHLENYSVCAIQEQCRAVGGDLYDVYLLKDNRLLFLVADVSGKGMGAALLMSNILASFRILYDGISQDFPHAVAQVSTELYRHSASDHFATLFIGILDPEKHRLQYINCGHNPACLLRTDSQLDHLEAGGLMIGILPEYNWPETSVDFNPGDQLVVFTDGVTEAGAENDEYGDDRFEKLITGNRDMAPGQLAELIITDIDNFTDNSLRSDDVTLFLIKRDK